MGLWVKLEHQVKGISEWAGCNSNASLRADGVQNQSTYDYSVIKIKVACPLPEVCSAGCQCSEQVLGPPCSMLDFFSSIYLNHFIFLLINLSIKKLILKKLLILYHHYFCYTGLLTVTGIFLLLQLLVLQ